MKNQVYSHLESVSQSRAQHIEYFIQEQKEKILILATHQEFSNDELKEIRDSNVEYTAVFVLDSDGKVIFSSEDSMIGVDKFYELYFIEGKKGIYVGDIHFSTGENEPSMNVATPWDGNVLVARVDISILTEIVLDKTGISETGETYLINKDNYAITPLLFVEDAILKFKVYSINSINCLSMLDNPIGREGEHMGHKPVQIFLDYRGEKVIGTHYPIYGVDWCFLVEIDEKEILGTQRELFQRVTFMVMLFVITIVTLIGFFVGKFIDKSMVLKKQKKKL